MDTSKVKLSKNAVEVKCRAKINLSLDVVGVRPDGYHNVELIFDEVNIYDTIKMSLCDNGINLTCTDTTLPTDVVNIAYRAAEAVIERLSVKTGVNIHIDKKIPHGAGLAGGSADAAGVLIGLNTLLAEKYPNTEKLNQNQLLEIGVSLGADVPFCLMGGTAFAEGIGEVLTPLNKPRFYYVIVKPPMSISTAYVYKNLDLNNRPKNLCVKEAAKGINAFDIQKIISNAGNIMETVTAKECPIINDIKDFMYKMGASLSLMSGSGTSVFGAFLDKEKTEKAAEEAKRHGDFGQVFVSL